MQVEKLVVRLGLQSGATEWLVLKSCSSGPVKTRRCSISARLMHIDGETQNFFVPRYTVNQELDRDRESSSPLCHRVTLFQMMHSM
jgi:hypothetical protein